LHLKNTQFISHDGKISQHNQFTFCKKKTRLRTGQRLTQKDRDKDLVHKDKYMYKDKLTTTKTGI